MIDEIIRRNRERFQNIFRRENISQFKFLKRNDNIFTFMSFFNFFAIVVDKFANFFFQLKQSKFQNQIVVDNYNIMFQSHVDTQSLKYYINNFDVNFFLKNHIQNFDNERKIRRTRFITFNNEI